MIHKRIVRYGEFTTQKEREDLGKDLRATHFRLGADPENTVSSYVYDYRRFGLGSDVKSEEPVSARVLAKTDFQLGVDPRDPRSSYTIDYPEKHGELSTLDKNIVKDLRATHYHLGSDPRSFGTIHKQDYVEKEIPRRDMDQIKDTRLKNRAQNFKFGDDPVNYHSTAADAYMKHPPRPLKL